MSEHIIKLGIQPMSPEDYWMDECQQRDATIAQLRIELANAQENGAYWEVEYGHKVADFDTAQADARQLAQALYAMWQLQDSYPFEKDVLNEAEEAKLNAANETVRTLVYKYLEQRNERGTSKSV